MKKIYALFLFAILIAVTFPKTSQAQTVKLNLYSDYYFDDGIEAITSGNNYFNGTIKGAYQWGAGVEYIFRPTYGVELLYMGSNTDVEVNSNTIIDTNRTFGLGESFIMLSGNKYYPIPKSIVSMYGGLMVGIAILNNKDPLPGGESSLTNFAWGARFGAEFKFSKAVGLKLHGQLLSAVQSTGGGFYLGTGGVGAGLNTESSMYQFGLGGGLVIYLGGK